MQIGPLTIAIKCKDLDEDYFGDMASALAESPDPHVAKRFLNDQFRFADRLKELLRFESGPAIAGEITVALEKTDLYFKVLAAVRAGEFDGLLGQETIDINHDCISTGARK